MMYLRRVQHGDTVRLRKSGRRPRRALFFAIVTITLLWSLVSFGAIGWSLPARGNSVRRAARAGAAEENSDDLLVYGAGYLGRRVARRWLADHPRARVVGVTRSEVHHGDLVSEGIEPVVAGLELSSVVPRGSFANVVFTASPGAGRRQDMPTTNYTEAMLDALSYWSGLESPGGSFVFTSSGGVFAEDSGGVVDESGHVSDSPKAALLLDTEECVRRAGGTVLRLAGLYDTLRGPHAHWLRSGVIHGSPNGFLNLIHYDDAAEAVLATLRHGPDVHGETFVIGDGVPVTRSEIVEAARSAPQFAGVDAPMFEGNLESTGKMYDVRKALATSQWLPRYKSFLQFMRQQR
eukprot:TRINITY_DN21296_c1_g3_i1.p1 TRINITY_DN21296_c1_g3~~TRINITY_DN21296_c1_g3_i1.p1  ORF type:complete len:349 (-),score=32.22 TRINITY_DN21296_c1_g3_i1:128-1174(-)